ncbi:DUF4358 domain-containing protein [Clostridiaceae bacterium M8S5]|nr:DUF4358 domain-containing protein [Clostridiaceae bacterium M8S5]
MRTKKTILSIIFMTMLLGILTGCFSSDRIKDFDMQGLATKLLCDIDFKDSLNKTQDHVVYNLYMLEDKDISSCVVYTSSAATVEEIAIFKASSSQSKTNIEEAIKTRIKDQKDAFSTYNPSEIKKLEDYTLVLKGDYVILCISDESNKALNIINDYITN